MTRHALAFLVLAAPSARAVELEVSVRVTRQNRGGFVELKAESDEKGEKATGHLTDIGVVRRFRWEMGSADQNAWYWWDTLDGAAELKVVVIGDSRVPVTLFEAPCAHAGKGEVQVGRTLALPVARLDPARHHYRRRPDMPPYIVENAEGSITQIERTDVASPRFGPDKVGNEWDLLH
jgi:hypothetical protein